MSHTLNTWTPTDTGEDGDTLSVSATPEAAGLPGAVGEAEEPTVSVWEVGEELWVAWTVEGGSLPGEWRAGIVAVLSSLSLHWKHATPTDSTARLFTVSRTVL